MPRPLLPLLGALAACAAPPPPDPALAQQAAAWMTGTFSSQAQHMQNRVAYAARRVVVHPIWLERDDGPWLYLEQADRASLARPYRQRVYHLVPTGGATLRGDIFTLPGEPLAWSGAWRTPAPLGDLSPADLTLRPGCSLQLRRVAVDRFAGGTDGDACSSQRAGAAFATAEVSLSPTRITSWNRGFDLAGRQVWGPVDGPYVFDKLSDRAPE